MKPRPKRRPQPVDKDKNRQRFVRIFSIVVVILLAMGFIVEIVVNYGGTTGTRPTKYGSYEFTLKQLDQGQVWVTQINGQEVEFQNLPVDVESYNVDPQAIGLMQQAQQIVLTADTNISDLDAQTVSYAKLELSLAIPKSVSAMTTPDDRYTLPVVNCSRATPQLPVVLFNVVNDTSVTTEGSCIIINAEQADILRLKDRIIFEYYGLLTNGQVN